MNKHIIGYDVAKENSDHTIISIGVNNSSLEELKELWTIGDEYLMTEYHRNMCNIPKGKKLIIVGFWEDVNDMVFMNLRLD